MHAAEPLVFSLREQIVERLRKDVLCGRLAEGERLSEVRLSEHFGVSRTPIREALLQLANEGLLVGRPNSGVKVAHRPPDAIRELIVPIRQRIEIFALRSIFSSINPDDFNRWGEILHKMRVACVAQDYEAIAEHDIEFHRSIVRRAGQPELDLLWATIVAFVRSHFWKTQRTNYADPIEIYDEHAGIVEIFRQGDLEAAVRAPGGKDLLKAA